MQKHNHETWKKRIYDSYLSVHFKNLHAMKREFAVMNRYYEKNYLKYFPANKEARILELGCGMGHFAYFCEEQGYTNYVGVDISSENIAYIKKKMGDDICVFIADMVDFLTDKENCYDVIVMNDVIEHFQKKEIFQVLDEIKNALKPRGVFLVKTYNLANPFTSVAGRYSDITHETGFTEISMKEVLGVTGFKKIKVVGTDIYVLNPVISIAAKGLSKLINCILFMVSALYGRTSIKIFEKDILGIAYK